MIEKRLDRIEDMLSQLIGMVAKLSEDQQEMKKELAGVKDEQQGMKQEQQGMKKELHEMKQEQQGMKKELHEMKQEQQGMKKELHEMKQEQQGMKKEQQGMKKELIKTNIKLDELEQKSEKRHEEVIQRFQAFERDKDFIWEKTVNNEREIGNLKRLF
ncbi:hypothetical protein BKP35_05090 [Anaerobacillus arseniciselenatis]|uniref:Uncharacterized protein n=1 Tax=Anaerobacillus arseniciselenatis TaxID=85682 RepID=A0A1S2LV36_9BACI|nr:hypothetical protein [Anaerobacillus arseniciselenatis]OIJ15225.1 hypothetical protein BKP35_05090 [Anaerobacillus arseniciselenatis]